MLSLLLCAVLAAACNGSGAQSDESPGGPCALSTDRIVGLSDLFVVYAGQEVQASLNYETVEYCPGHEMEGLEAIHGDGFLVDLDEAFLTAEPGALVEIRGPGYPGAELTADIAVEDEYVDESGERVWLLRLPDEAGEHEIRLNLKWGQGHAEYAFVTGIGTVTFGPARLETAMFGVLALDDDAESRVYFHLGESAQSYGDGAGGIVYQSLAQWRLFNEIDVMRLAVDADMPEVVLPAGGDSQQLQGISNALVLTIRAREVNTEGVLSHEGSRLVLTDLESGENAELMAVDAEQTIGMGRASLREDRIVVSLRSEECTWLEFLDLDGDVINEPRNPRPETEACSRPLVTGAVLLEDNLLAYVETKPDFENEFDGNPHHYVRFIGAPRQAIVISDLDDGKMLHRVDIEPSGTVARWLEPVPGGVSVSLGALDFGDLDSSELPLLSPAPAIGDLGSDLGLGTTFTYPAGSLLITVANGDLRRRDWWISTTVAAIREEGICSGALSQDDIGPPTGVTGLGTDIPITIYEPTPEADATRDAIIAAARACDYEGLAALATQEKPSPAFFSGPDFEKLAEHWEDLENSGERPLAALVALLEHPPTGQNPFRWDAVRGDMVFSSATVSIHADGSWVGFQTP